MTRINIVPVTELCDQHLLAEFRELTRIPNTIMSGKAKVILNEMPKEYTMGKGHVKFFYDKLLFLQNRYNSLYHECVSRGFNVNMIWPTGNFPNYLYKNYVPTEEAIRINRDRIAERLLTMKSVRYTPYIR